MSHLPAASKSTVHEQNLQQYSGLKQQIMPAWSPCDAASQGGWTNFEVIPGLKNSSMIFEGHLMAIEIIDGKTNISVFTLHVEVELLQPPMLSD